MATTDDWSTPYTLYSRIARIWNCTTDVCATAENTKCKHFFTKEMNGLRQPWRGTCWMNPPYGRGFIGKWVRKAYRSAQQGAIVVCLLPASTGAPWFQLYVLNFAEYQFLPGRLTFGAAATVAPFWSVLAIFKLNAQPGHKVLI